MLALQRALRRPSAALVPAVRSMAPLSTLARAPLLRVTALGRRAPLQWAKPRGAAVSSSSASPAKSAAERRHEMVEKGKSSWGKLKDLWQKYGIVAVGTYFTMYGVVLGSIYVAIEQGWVSTAKASIKPKDGEPPADGEQASSFNLVTATNKVVSLAEDLGIAKHMDLQRVNSKTGSFVIAWVATKFTEPLRLAITLAITPRIARLVGRAPKKVVQAATKA